MKKKIGDILKFIIFIGIGIFFIYWFLIKLSPEQKHAIWQSFLGANYWWVGVAMLCCLCSHLVRALRWQLLFKPLGQNPGIVNTFGAVVVAYMANLAFPRLGEVLRCAVLRTSEKIPIQQSLGTVVTERVIDVLLFLLIVAVGILVMFSTVKDWIYNGLVDKVHTLPSMAVLLVIGIILLIGGIVFYKYFWHKLLHINFFHKIDELLKGCIEGVKSILHMGKKSTWLFVFYSFLIYFLYILGGVIIFQAFKETQDLTFEAAFVLYLFGSVGMGLSQGGLGVYPVLVQTALAIYGISLEVGTACGWLLWGLQQVVVITVGMGFLIYFSIQKKKSVTNIPTP
ncbi:MAG: flippase-like domain-containing protein [Bacteroidales bacterium]|nr:flippase-like domain-containing protein [Bacteroidales bacterium]